MKIALVTNNYRPYSGGVVSAIDTLSSSLVQLGHQVQIITLDFEGLGSNYDGLVPVVRLVCPIRFKYKTNHIAVPWLPDQAVLNLLTYFKPDIIHTHHPFLLGISALKAGQKLDLPVVFTYHSQYEKFAHLVPIPQIISACVIRQKALAYCNRVSGIIAPSKTISQNLLNLGCNSPIIVIPSAISPIYLDMQFNYKLRQKTFKLLTVSRFAKEKNLIFLLDMFKKLLDFSPDFSLTLVGYGPELATLKHHAYHVLGLSQEQVVFVERPDKLKIKQLYQQSDLFVFASQAETQGLVLAEAMACGTPVVALVGAGQDDVVVNRENGFLVADLPQMVQAILEISNNSVLHEKMQQNAYQTGQYYNPTMLAQDQIEFYKHF